jgi:hypothetical protein
MSAATSLPDAISVYAASYAQIPPADHSPT